MGRRNDIDWEAIEKEYRLGQKSIRQMAAEFKVQPSAISRRATKSAWVQDKAAEVKAISEAQLLISNTGKATGKATPTQADVMAAAVARTDLVLQHRTDIRRGRSVAMKLMDELESQCDNMTTLQQVAEMLVGQPIDGDDPDAKAMERDRQKMWDSFQKAVSLGGRISNVKTLSDAMKNLVAMERQAFNVDDEGSDGKGGRVEDWLDSL